MRASLLSFIGCLIILMFCPSQLMAGTEETFRSAFTGHTYPLVLNDLQYFLADNIKQEKVDFTIIAGDVVLGDHAKTRSYSIWNKAAEEEQWDRYKMLRNRIGGTVYWAAGNHDIGSRTDFDVVKRATDQEQLYFSFDKLGMRFIVLCTVDVTTEKRLAQPAHALSCLRYRPGI